ncbi:MAG: NTP transferase domain-containing protein [Desulfobacterales bacterium]|nr:NTP transferase domain-containing protein [Desulfobacterales bacterium]
MLNQAVILAGGLGTRLGELTKNISKPMLSVGGRPFLEYIIWNLKRQGITKILLLVGYQAESIIEHFRDGNCFNVQIEYVVENKPAGTGGALRMVAEKLDSVILVLNGDTLFDISYLDLASFREHTCTMASLGLRVVENASRYGSVVLKNELITGFLEKSRYSSGIISGGMYVLHRDVLNYLPDSPSSLEHDLFPILASTGKLSGKIYEGFFIDIGIPETLRQASEDVPRWINSFGYRFPDK